MNNIRYFLIAVIIIIQVLAIWNIFALLFQPQEINSQTDTEESYELEEAPRPEDYETTAEYEEAHMEWERRMGM